ncbi:MAG: dihydroxyacetone kinase subunit DhaK [Rhodospirillaceae bacterium]|nr:dihydroxyacetone kinase subunit DhaK [Rhodospirillaceae bacterium]
MQRIINNPDELVEDTVKGWAKAHKDHVHLLDGNARVLVANGAPKPGKVGIVTGGGSGHEPAFLGYVGRNLVDAVAIGEIFSSPTAKAFADAIKACNAGAGVAVLYGNYAGDNMNVKMAAKMVDREGIAVKTVVANDDVPSAPASERDKRRGVAGEILMWKVGGAKAATGADLDAVIAAAQKAIDNCRSIGIGLTPCTIPAVGHANFAIEPGKMELGIGHHGEPGIEVTDLKTADEMAQVMVDTVLPDLPFAAGDEVVVLLSGLGATPINELFVVYNKVDELLAEKGISIYRPYVGNYFTSLEMMGLTLTVMKLDDELKALIDMDCDAYGFRQFAKGS